MGRWHGQQEATLLSSQSRKGSNVAQLAVAIADTLGDVLQLAAQFGVVFSRRNTSRRPSLPRRWPLALHFLHAPVNELPVFLLAVTPR